MFLQKKQVDECSFKKPETPGADITASGVNLQDEEAEEYENEEFEADAVSEVQVSLSQ